MNIKSICKAVFFSGIIALSLLLFAGIAGAAPIEEWNRTFRGAGNASASSVQQTADGGYIISGSSCSYEQCSPWLLKTDADGNEQWNKTFSSDYGARSVLQTRDGGYIFVGRSLVKVDLSGSEQWTKIYGEGTIYSIQWTADGGYIGAGLIPEAPGSDHPDGWLIKMEENGDEQWNRSFWGGGLGWIKSVLQTKDGGYALAGMKGKYGALLIKVDENGKEQWNWTFGEWNRTLMGRGYSANSVVQSDDGGYFMAGTMDVPVGIAAMFIKIDGNGSMQWCKSRIFKGKMASVANSARQTEDGGYIIAGESHTEGGRNKDGWLIKLYENGTEQWNMIFGGTQDDEFFSVWNTEDGGYVVAGTTSDSSGGSYVKLIKVKGEKTKPVKIPTVSPTVTLKASPIQTLTTVPTETLKVSPSEKAPGFEVVLSITIFLAVYKTGRKRW